MGSTDSPPIPYWQVNVPPEERTEECPDFLRDLSAKDVGILSTPDADYAIQSWPAVRETVAANRLDLFQRVPSELRRYLAYNWQLKQDYGSVMDFVLARRLRWAAPVTARGRRPFEDPDDVRILWNDWPYGIDERIVHLVVWTKFDLAEDPETGDLTDEARAEIAAFVDRTFSPRLARDQYIWFKNWRSLKSIRSVEHFHVMLFDPPLDFIQELTNGDIPLSKKLQQARGGRD